jgi:hypothetical protein
MKNPNIKQDDVVIADKAHDMVTDQRRERKADTFMVASVCLQHIYYITIKFFKKRLQLIAVTL